MNWAGWMTPPKETLDQIDWDGMRKKLTATDYDNDLKRYVGRRLDYAFAFDWEAPTVLTELAYYLKAKGKTGDDFSADVSRYSSLFHKARVERKGKS